MPIIFGFTTVWFWLTLGGLSLAVAVFAKWWL